MEIILIFEQRLGLISMQILKILQKILFLQTMKNCLLMFLEDTKCQAAEEKPEELIYIS